MSPTVTGELAALRHAVDEQRHANEAAMAESQARDAEMRELLAAAAAAKTQSVPECTRCHAHSAVRSTDIIARQLLLNCIEE